MISVYGLPVEKESANAENNSLQREKRSFFPWVIGETILDIQCKRGYITVCAPDGPDGCAVGYSSQTNVGECGFATLNHYLNTTNIAGTCCYKLPSSSSSVTTTTASSSASNSSNILIPQIIAYPVYAQYPYAIQSSSNTGSTGSTGSSGSYGSSGSSYSSPSSGYGK